MPRFSLFLAFLLAFFLVAPLQADEIQPIFHFADPRITECSGLVASRLYPGLFWAHNDSGDSARLFLVNSKGGTVATVALQGATAQDWEDMAAAGEWIYVGDIGDNLKNRPEITIYRFHEPALDATKLNQELSVEPQTQILRYPDGPRDAETLAATPDGRVLVVSKDVKGSNFYFSNPFEPGSISILEKVREFQFPGAGIFERLATGGDFSPDGRELAVMTYTNLYRWKLPAPFDVASVQTLKPEISPVPRLKQGEAVCYNLSGDALLISSEGEKAPVFELPIAP